MPVCLIFHLDCTLLVSVEMESIYFVHLSSDAIEVKILPSRAGVYSPLCDTLDPYKCLRLFSSSSCCPASPAPFLKSSSHTFTNVALGFVTVPYQTVLTASMLLFSTQLTSELCQKNFFKFSWGYVRLSSSLRKLTAFSEYFNY